MLLATLFAQSTPASPEYSLWPMVAKNIVPITAIALGVLWLIVLTIAEQWRKVRVAEQNAVLKKEMLERGFSADEIVRVIRNGGPGDKMALNSKAKPNSSE